jgi:hypothetical protein
MPGGQWQAGDVVPPKGKRSADIHFRVTTLAESLRYFNGLAVGETAAILSEAKVGAR